MPNFLRRTLLVLVLTVGFFGLHAQNIFWTDVKESSFSISDNQTRTIKPEKFRSFIVDTIALKAALQTAPKEFTEAAKESPLILSFPMPDGSVSRFAVVSSSMMEPELEAQFPNIKTYSGQGLDDKAATLKMDWTDFGLHVQVLSPNISSTFYVDPYARGEKTQYMVYQRKDLLVENRQFIEQGVIKEQMSNMSGYANRTTAGICRGSQLRTYRTAVACTGQYAAAVGASTASSLLSTVTTTINRVNGIYETELSIRLTLIGAESSILFLSTTTPFSAYANDNATCNGCASEPQTLINRSQTVIDSVIGNSNYDIGHTFSTGAGGLAGLGVVCNSSQKARGVTGSDFPLGDAYDVDYVAHEMGHEFGGNHTFNATTGSCGGGNRNASTSVEPGSGITIMAYAGICGATNDLAAHSIPYFHAVSENEIATYITVGGGSSCGTVTTTGNSVPVVNAGSNYTIPKGTPFALTGSATDANNSEVLTYSWEEIDPGTSSGNWNSGGKPFFRSFNPTTSPTRYFPKLSTLAIDGTSNNVIGEFLPSTAQTLNFRLTTRDNRSGGGGICSADMIVTVNGSTGPFNVSTQWSPESWVANGTNQKTVSWDVGGTDGAPINCSNVSILFSADGGLTFPYTLLASTPNSTGSATITVPNIQTTKGRIMVKAIGNIFFDINEADITITSSCASVGATVTPAASVSALAGNSALNLNLAPTYTSFIPAGTIVATDPQTDLILRNTSTNACGAFYNRSRYQSYTFSVTVTGSYTFTFNSGSALQAALYNAAFNEDNPCSGLLVQSGSYNPSTGVPSLASSITNTLTAGNTYVLVIGTFSSTQPTLPASYKLTITGAGVAYLSGQPIYANPGAGFSYTYVVVKNSTGIIVSIGSSDLSNSTTYPAGQYTVYGLSYSTSISNLNSYVGGAFSALSNQILNNPGTFCADLSKNSVTVNVTGTFPVQFTALKARKQGEKVALDWGTLSEQNTSHFMVQRSGNGSEFSTEIGKVKAAGNSNSELKYNFVDVNPIKGWNYYRIKQVDLDGKFTYSNIAAVNFEKGSGSMVIYPNPAKDQLNVEYTSERSGKLELQVIDSKGSVLISNSMQVTTGRNLQTLNISNLSTGMYLLKYIDADGNISFTKFVKQ